MIRISAARAKEADAITANVSGIAEGEGVSTLPLNRITNAQLHTPAQ